jgi:hypothetical protein
MADTKLSNLINPDLFADAVSAKLGDAIKLRAIAFEQDLEGQPGGTISVPKFAYVGDADTLTEGVAMDPALLSETAATVNVVEAGKSIEINDKAALNGYGDTIGEAEKQVVTSVASKIEKDMMAALGTAILTYDATTAGFNGDAVLEGLAKFGEDQEGEKFLFINAVKMASIKKDPAYIAAENKIHDCEVVISNRVPATSSYIVKPGAVGLYWKKGVDVETGRDQLKRSTVLSATSQFATHLRNDALAVKITHA